MKKLLFIPVIFCLFSVLSHAQNNTVFTTKISWDFTNNTGESVDGIRIEIVPGFKIEKGTANSQPVIIAAPINKDGKAWQCSNFRVELGHLGVVKFDVQKSGDRRDPIPVFCFYFTRNGQQVGKIQTAKTDFSGNIPTQLGSR